MIPITKQIKNQINNNEKEQIKTERSPSRFQHAADKIIKIELNRR